MRFKNAVVFIQVRRTGKCPVFLAVSLSRQINKKQLVMAVEQNKTYH